MEEYVYGYGPYPDTPGSEVDPHTGEPVQDIGGYVYEKAYFNFRFPPPRHLGAAELDDFHKENIAPLEEALDEVLQPTMADNLCYIYAMELFAATERHGLPSGGGWRDEDAFDLYVIDCIHTARERARREAEALQEKIRMEEERSRQAEAEANQNTVH